MRRGLSTEYNLTPKTREKMLVRVEDEFKLLHTLWTDDRMSFNHERYRIQLALIMQLAGVTGNRPAALLALCYRHVVVALLPDPKGERQPRVLIEIKFDETKGYLGKKEA